MRSSRTVWKTVGFIATGAIIGTLAGQLLAHQFVFLGRETSVSWHPQANIGILSFSLAVTFRVNWLTLAGVIAAWGVSRRK